MLGGRDRKIPGACWPPPSSESLNQWNLGSVRHPISNYELSSHQIIYSVPDADLYTCAQMHAPQLSHIVSVNEKDPNWIPTIIPPAMQYLTNHANLSSLNFLLRFQCWLKHVYKPLSVLPLRWVFKKKTCKLLLGNIAIQNVIPVKSKRNNKTRTLIFGTSYFLPSFFHFFLFFKDWHIDSVLESEM